MLLINYANNWNSRKASEAYFEQFPEKHQPQDNI